MKVIITELDPDHWRVSHVSYYQGTPLEGKTIETFKSLDEAVQFANDIKAEVVEIDSLDPFPQYAMGPPEPESGKGYTRSKSMSKKVALKVHIVVAEYGGIVEGVLGFLHKKDARKKQSELRAQKAFNEDEDLITLWEITLPIPKSISVSGRKGHLP